MTLLTTAKYYQLLLYRNSHTALLASECPASLPFISSVRLINWDASLTLALLQSSWQLQDDVESARCSVKPAFACQ